MIPAQQSSPVSSALSLMELMWAVSMKSPLIFLLTRYSPSPTKRKAFPAPLMEWGSPGSPRSMASQPGVMRLWEWTGTTGVSTVWEPL